MTTRQTATLRNWAHVEGHLYGNAYGHPDPRIFDGAPVCTSRVVEMGDGWAKTLNTDYTLDGPPVTTTEAP